MGQLSGQGRSDTSLCSVVRHNLTMSALFRQYLLGAFFSRLLEHTLVRAAAARHDTGPEPTPNTRKR